MKKIRLTAAFVILLATAFWSCKTAPDEGSAGHTKNYNKVPVLDAVEDLVGSGDYAAAAEQIGRLSEDERKQEDTVLLYSSLLISSGKLEEARNELNMILAADPDNSDALLNLAIIEGISGDLNKQISILKKITDKDPDNSLAQAATGDFYLTTRRYNQAKKHFQKSLAVDPDNVYAQLGMGRALLLQGETSAAIEYFDKVLDTDEPDSLAYAERARARTELSDYKSALEDLTKAIEIRPDYYWFYIDRGKLRQTMIGDYRLALDDFNKAIELNPDYFYPYLYRGQINDALKNYDAALKDYEYVVENKPDYYYAWVPLAILYYFNEQWDNAALYFQKAYSIEKDPGFALMAAVCGLRGTNPKETEKFLQRYISGLSREGGYYQVGRAFLEPGYDGYALHVVNKLKDKAEAARCLFYLAIMYQNQGNKVLSRTYFEEVIEGEMIGLMEYKLAEFELGKAEYQE
ncbi:MAG: tetratricopeptide repeat protein [Spirochaetales bacterium]|nr:tetratricopeptide repeat protein [Spirochaetales bacterium]